QGRSGGRGLRQGGPAPGTANNPNVTGAVDQLLVANRVVSLSGNNSAWWTNNALLTQLGVSDDQRLKLEQAFERNRQSLTASKANLEKEEAQLAKLLDVDQVDRAGIATQ